MDVNSGPAPDAYAKESKKKTEKKVRGAANAAKAGLIKAAQQNFLTYIVRNVARNLINGLGPALLILPGRHAAVCPGPRRETARLSPRTPSVHSASYFPRPLNNYTGVEKRAAHTQTHRHTHTPTRFPQGVLTFL